MIFHGKCTFASGSFVCIYINISELLRLLCDHDSSEYHIDRSKAKFDIFGNDECLNDIVPSVDSNNFMCEIDSHNHNHCSLQNIEPRSFTWFYWFYWFIWLSEAWLVILRIFMSLLSYLVADNRPSWNTVKTREWELVHDPQFSFCTTLKSL